MALAVAANAALRKRGSMLIRMLLVGYRFGIRSERRLSEEVHLNLA